MDRRPISTVDFPKKRAFIIPSSQKEGVVKTAILQGTLDDDSFVAASPPSYFISHLMQRLDQMDTKMTSVQTAK
jgi:hypothetical protein